MTGVRRFGTFLSVYYALMLEYRAELLLWMLTGSLPFIMMGVWSEAAASGGFSMSPAELSQYFIAVFLTRQATFVWVIWDFERLIVEGKLSSRLLQPVDPVWHHMGEHLAERAARMPLALVLVVLCAAIVPHARFWPGVGNILLFTVIVTGAFLLRFLIQYTLAMVAFFTERAASLESFLWLAYWMLSGLIAPLELFPPNVRAVAELTPFPYLVHFPSQVLLGRSVDWAQAALVCGAWGAVCLIINRWLWHTGLRRYSAMGA